MSKKAEYLINTNIHGIKKGQTITLDVDDNGTPLLKTWRNRVRDSKIDGCITLIVQPKKSKPTAKKDD